MGLFSKKPKSIIVPTPAVKPTSEAAATIKTEAPADAIFDLSQFAQTEASTLEAALAPVVRETPTLAKPPEVDPPKLMQSPRPLKPGKKNKKFGVDPIDFLALRAELIDMRARLDESEQARAQVEARLSALDATTSAFSSERTDISEVATMVLQLQQEIKVRTRPTTGEIPATGTGHDELSAKVDALQNRLFGLHDHGPKIAQFEAQLTLLRAELETATAEGGTPQNGGLDPNTYQQIATMQQRLDEVDQLKQRLGELDQLKQQIGVVDQVHQRLDVLDNVEQRLASIDGLAAQLQQLNARVAAQAELGGQLSALRDSVGQLSDQPHGPDDDVRLQLQELGERTKLGEELRSQIGQLAERMSSNDTEARMVREHLAVLNQRLTNLGTELANQISELGRDIDGLGQRVPEIADGSVSDEVVDALRGGQVKLANEQARYEIAFRQDLAALAEQLRRPSN